MNEALNLRTIAGRECTAQVISSENVNVGTEPKRILELQLGQKKISLLHRTLESELSVPRLTGFDYDDANIPLADRYVHGMRLLQERGFPVPQAVRKISVNEVVVSNVVVLGGAVYDVKDQVMNNIFRGNKSEKAMDEVDMAFSQLDINTLSSLCDQSATLASQQGVLLAEDSPYHIVFKPNSDSELMILDISKMIIGYNHEAVNAYLDGSGITIEEYNKMIAERWIQSASLLQDHFRRIQ